MKKKIFTVLTAIALISVLSICLFACNNKDGNKLNENTDFEKLKTEEVAEQGWKDAFKAADNFTVKINITTTETIKTPQGDEEDAQEEKTETYTYEYIYSFTPNKVSHSSYSKYGDEYEKSDSYVVLQDDESLLYVRYWEEAEEDEDGKLITEKEGPYGEVLKKDEEYYEEEVEEYFGEEARLEGMFAEVLADNFSKFTYDADKGAYVCAKLEIKDEENSYTSTYENMAVKIVDGKLAYVSYTGTHESNYYKSVYNYVYTYYNYGSTKITVPEYTEAPEEE